MKATETRPIFLFAAVFALIFSVTTIVRNTFDTTVHNGFLLFLMIFVIVLMSHAAFIKAASEYNSKISGVAEAFAALSLFAQISTAAYIPVAYFISKGRKDILHTGDTMSSIKYMGDCFEQSVGFIAAAAAAWLIIRFGRPLLARFRGKMLMFFSGILTVLGGLLIIHGIKHMSSKNNEATTTTLGHIHMGYAGICLMIIVFCMILEYGGYGSKEKKKLFAIEIINMVFAVISIITAAAGFVLCEENGLLIFFMVSVAVWYLFFSTRPKLKPVLQISTGIFCLGISAALIFSHFYIIDQENNNLLHLGSKLDRMGVVSLVESFEETADKLIPKSGKAADTDNVPKVEAAVEEVSKPDQRDLGVTSIVNTGIFGETSPCIIPVAGSDYAIAGIEHYMGPVWLFIYIVLVTVCALKGAVYWSSVSESRPENYRPLSIIAYVFVLVSTSYNILANLGVLAIIGVSSFATGYGMWQATASGFFFGLIICPLRSSPTDKAKSKIQESADDPSASGNAPQTV